MALAESPFRVNLRGEWPGPITFRRGWARAEARRWNDAEPSASLRLVRGGPGFLQACAGRLCELGAPSVLSPPVPTTARRTWETAGFSDYLKLALMRLSLDEQPGSPDHLVVEDNATPMATLLCIDQAAFDPFWRFDEHGMREAIDATSSSTVLVIRDAVGGAAGFAIVGFGSAISYLQRVAVHPDWQGQGMGRSLVRVAARKARAAGARVMLLNTQLDNRPALKLYEQEGFVSLPEPLSLLRCEG